MAKSFDNINRLVVGELDISQDQKRSYKITMTGDALKFLNRSNSSETLVLNKDGSCTFSNNFIINNDGSVSMPTVSSVVPSSPDSGGVVYIKSDGKLYFKNSSGEEYLLSDNVSGEVQTSRIAYTDGTDAITIEDGGYLKFAQGNRYSDSVLVSSDHSDHNEFIKFASYTSRDDNNTTETTFLVTMVGWENHTAHDGDATFIVNVKYTYASGSPYYYAVGTRVTCEPINGSTLNGFDPSTDVILTVGSAGADLYIKAKEQNKRCFVSILGGTNQNDTSVSDESWQILTGQTWTSSVTSQGTNIGGTWVDKSFKDVDVDGTLEADAITVNGTALDTHIAGVTVTNATNATKAYITAASNNLAHIIVFADSTGGNEGLQGDTSLRWNPSTNCLGIGTTSPKVPADIYNMGGLVLAMKNNHYNESGTGTNTYKTFSTTMGSISSGIADVTFTCPASAKVIVQCSFYMVGVGNDVATKKAYYGIHDGTGYVYDVDGVRFDQIEFFDDRGFNGMQSLEATISKDGSNANLVPGTNYTFQVHFKSQSSSRHRIYYGQDYPAIITKVLSAPNTIL